MTPPRTIFPAIPPLGRDIKRALADCSPFFVQTIVISPAERRSACVPPDLKLVDPSSLVATQSAPATTAPLFCLVSTRTPWVVSFVTEAHPTNVIAVATAINAFTRIPPKSFCRHTQALRASSGEPRKAPSSAPPPASIHRIQGTPEKSPRRLVPASRSRRPHSSAGW